MCESDITDYLETESRDRTLDMPCTPAMVEVAATGKVEATATEPADVGECTDEAVKAPTRSVMARPVAMAGAPKPIKECSSEGMLQVWQGRPNKGQLHGQAVQPLQRTRAHCRCCPTSEEEAVLAMTGEVGARVDVGDDYTVQA